jgi:hypothetical protein
MTHKFAILIAISPVLCITIGLLVGMIRYRKYGDEIRKRVEKEFEKKRARGGIHSLYHKRPDKRVSYETYGIPLCIGFFAGFMMLLIIFKIF